MVVAPIASALAVVSPEEMDVGCVCVDIGGGTTDIAIFTNGAIAYTCSLPVGGQMVTSDIYKLLKTSPEEAERLKLDHGGACAKNVKDEHVEIMQLGHTHARPMQRRVLCEIIESRMREIATLVRQHIERSGQMGMLTAGVILTGGGSALPGSIELFEQSLKHMRVRAGVPHDRLAGSPCLSVAYGLAAYALDAVDDEIAPAGSLGSWKEKIRSLTSRFTAKA